MKQNVTFAAADFYGTYLVTGIAGPERVRPFGNLFENELALIIVAIPMLVPINRTLAPMRAFPLLASTTFPFNVICPNEMLVNVSTNSVVSTIILFIKIKFKSS